ncbi:MAG: phosphotriesterase [Saprospiraceae bacterium]|nr:phosphotriesterase [Saprospiraceae bacterium]
MRIKLCLILLMIFTACSEKRHEDPYIITVNGVQEISDTLTWLSHEHILVDFIGADSIDTQDWDHDEVMDSILPFLEEIKKLGVDIFVDATPQYLGRDVLLLKKLSKATGLRIITNTGLYGAVNDKYVPSFAFDRSSKELADTWIEEFEESIEGTGIYPGFIKVSVDNNDTLDPIDKKIIEAAGITSLTTGMTIASHTGHSRALWSQLDVLESLEVPMDQFIWVHAQNETDNNIYLKAAEKGCWISLDGLGWELEQHLSKIQFAKENDILDHILISHDAGWFDPQKDTQDIKPYSAIFKNLKSLLLENGFTENEWRQLMIINPAKAFSINGTTH